VIELVNGQPVNSSQHLVELVSSSKGLPLSLTFERSGSKRTVTLQPTLDSASGLYRMGAWVRDSTAGVGTLSYYNSENGTYGALGHAINDGDTGKLLPVKSGALMLAEIVDIKKGKRGDPGELRGSFLKDQTVLGDIEENTSLGIYGKLDQPYVNPLYPDGLPVGFQESVTLGPATILSTLDGEGVKEYQVEIVQAQRQIAPSEKSMVIRVTDPRLLGRTGGIVQGMSGSPILQNGRIVGAVTHVSVDP
jgi:stage IV sporulation protein B